MDYVVFDLEFLYHMANMIRSNVGTIFSVCLHLFIAVLSICLILRIVSYFAGYFTE